MFKHLIEIENKSRLEIQQQVKRFTTTHEYGEMCDQRTFKNVKDVKKAILILNDMISSNGLSVRDDLISSFERDNNDILIFLRFESNDINRNKKGVNLAISTVYMYNSTDQMPLCDYILLAEVINLTIKK